MTIGGATTIEDVMLAANKADRRIPNSGNYRKQTFAGAVAGGTRGFGADAFMADWTEVTKTNGVITECVIPLLPRESWMLTTCVCSLQDIEFPAENNRMFFYLPYSRKNRCIVADYEPAIGKWSSRYLKGDPNKPAHYAIRLWWHMDNLFPWTRQAQRLLDYLPTISKKSYTAYDDIDAMYHPYPWVDNGKDFWLNIYKPTHTSYNMCLEVTSQDVPQFLTTATKLAPKYLLRSFIGVREHGSTCSVDFYCRPRKFRQLNELQLSLEKLFTTFRHPSKTI